MVVIDEMFMKEIHIITEIDCLEKEFALDLKRRFSRRKGMKLAEALLERADLQKTVNDLYSKLRENSVVQADDKPTEDPVSLLAELKECYRRLDEFDRRINLTNNTTVFDEGKGWHLCDALTQRGSLDKQISNLTSLASSFVVKSNRYSNSEIKLVATMNPSEIRTHVDHLKKERKELDRRIQALNWELPLKD